MTFKYEHKKTQTSKTQWKEEKRTKSDRERESTPFRATVELLSAVSPPMSWRCLSGFATLFNLETIAQPQHHHYDQNPSRTSEEEPKKNEQKNQKNELKYEQNPNQKN